MNDLREMLPVRKKMLYL